MCSGTVVVFDNKEKDVEIKDTVKIRNVVLWIVKNGMKKAENEAQFKLLKNECVALHLHLHHSRLFSKTRNVKTGTTML